LSIDINVGDVLEAGYLTPKTDVEVYADYNGGSKSPDHIAGQERLERIGIAHHLFTEQEERLWCFNEIGELKQYQGDVVWFDQKWHKIVDLEVDKYGPHQGKRKNTKEMSNRDNLIGLRYRIPVVRFDVMNLTHPKNAEYMTDEDIFIAIYDRVIKYYKTNALVIGEVKLI